MEPPLGHEVPTRDWSSAAGRPAAALLPQAGQLCLQHLQPVQDVLDVGQVVVAAAGLLGDVDAVREHNLVVAVHRLLQLLGALDVGRSPLVFALAAATAAAGGVEVHGAEGGGGDVDVVHVVEDHGLVRVGQCEVLLGLGSQGLPAVAEHLLDQAGRGEVEEEGHTHQAQQGVLHPHDDESLSQTMAARGNGIGGSGVSSLGWGGTGILEAL